MWSIAAKTTNGSFGDEECWGYAREKIFAIDMGHCSQAEIMEMLFKELDEALQAADKHGWVSLAGTPMIESELYTK